MRTIACVGVVLIFGAGVARPQKDDLARHGVIGLAAGPANDKQPEDARSNPLTIKTVVSDGAGAAAGIHVGDVIDEIDGATVSSSSEFARAIGRRLAGERVSLRLIRGGNAITVTATLKPRPFETSPDAEVLYRAVRVDGARRRVIVTRPEAPGSYPAVLLIGGLGCYSLDGALASDRGYGPILAALAKRRFVTMRVEKSGEGDSEGPPCTDAQATAELEAEGYLAGLRALKSYNFVDRDQVFVFAHSLGPLIASLVLPRESVRGVVAAETIGRSWFEYGLENVRRQSALAGDPLDEVDAEVRAHERCAHDFYVLSEPAEEVAKHGAQCRDMIQSYAGVPGPYMQQIGDISLAKQWKQIDAAVEVIYGTSDPATSADESRYLVKVINSFHPGRATYLELPEMAHDFTLYASQAEFLNRHSSSAFSTALHPYDTALINAVVKWLEAQLSHKLSLVGEGRPAAAGWGMSGLDEGAQFRRTR